MEVEIRRETDCLLEGNGFELPVRGRGESGYPAPSFGLTGASARQKFVRIHRHLDGFPGSDSTLSRPTPVFSDECGPHVRGGIHKAERPSKIAPSKAVRFRPGKAAKDALNPATKATRKKSAPPKKSAVRK